MFVALHAEEQLALAQDVGWEEIGAAFEPMAGTTGPVVPALAWAAGFLYAISGRIDARLGRAELALRRLELLVPWLERAPAWTIHYPMMASHAVDILCLLERTDHAAGIEDVLRAKVIEPDYRDSMVDGRLALARLCVLQGRHDEARRWFAEARQVLTEQGARPLLAIADYDEALLYLRRGGQGDLDRARHLLDAAGRQFEAIGMTGWIRRAEELTQQVGLRG
jgi:tetratricopeptide (TPR) repeat protein